MKFRIKFVNKTFQVVLNDDNNVSLRKLKDESAAILEKELGFIPRSFDLSLNGKDVLTEMDKPLSDFGIVSGDLLRILCNDDYEVTSSAPEILTSHLRPSNDDISQIYSSNPISTPTSTIQAHDELSVKLIEEDADESTINSRYFNEPMLCRDSLNNRVPEMLQQLYSSVEIQNNSEALCIVLHDLMLETGFRPVNAIIDTEAANSQDITASSQNLTSIMPPEWRQLGMYSFQYNHHSCVSLTCIVNCVPLANQIIVEGNIENIDSSSDPHLILIQENFVIGTDFQKDAAQVYYNLPKLSRIFKDAIAYPLLVNMQNAAGLLPQFGLISLSVELKLYILSFLNFQNLLKMTEVCKDFNILAKEPGLWKKIYFKDFGGKSRTRVPKDWLQFYRTKYLEQRWRVDARSIMDTVQPPVICHNPRPLTPFYPDDMIGGDYDIEPVFDPNPLNPLYANQPNLFIPQRPRFDPYGPLPEHHIRPGRQPRNPFSFNSLDLGFNSFY